MSDKKECPGCGSYGSDVLADYENGRPCRRCGLAPDTADEITAARKRGADADLTERLAEALKRASKAEAESHRLRTHLESLISAAQGVARQVADKQPWLNEW